MAYLMPVAPVWYLRVDKELAGISVYKSMHDQAIFYWWVSTEKDTVKGKVTKA